MSDDSHPSPKLLFVFLWARLCLTRNNVIPSGNQYKREIDIVKIITIWLLLFSIFSFFLQYLKCFIPPTSNVAEYKEFDENRSYRRNHDSFAKKEDLNCGGKLKEQRSSSRKRPPSESSLSFKVVKLPERNRELIKNW